MKKIILLSPVIVAFTCCLSINVPAQAKKGNWLLEGNIGNIDLTRNNAKYQGQVYSNSSEGNNFEMSLYPRAGYFFSDVLVVGAELDFGFSHSSYKGFNDKHEILNSTKYSQANIGLLPFIRYYVVSSKNGRSKFYAELAGGANRSLSMKNKSSYYDPATGEISSTSKYEYPKKYFNFSGSITAGYNHFFTDDIALNINLGYRFSRIKETSSIVYEIIGQPATTSDASTYTYTVKGITWGTGLSMFIHCRKKIAKR